MVCFREPDGPEVELFDLDEALSSQRVRLAQITNRCRPDEITDLEVNLRRNYCYSVRHQILIPILQYMLTMSGEALGINKDLKNKDPISILRKVFDFSQFYVFITRKQPLAAST